MSKKRVYRKGMELIHNDNKSKILFGNWKDKDNAVCLSSDKSFITISRKDLDTYYLSVAEINNKAKERRKYQGW